MFKKCSRSSTTCSINFGWEEGCLPEEEGDVKKELEELNDVFQKRCWSGTKCSKVLEESK